MCQKIKAKKNFTELPEDIQSRCGDIFDDAGINPTAVVVARNRLDFAYTPLNADYQGQII
ncbi:MAG: hypothetical protein M5U10_09310 [Candidatus Methanoperedens sp.]|uniref:hypothetical protein n=1 Tax=Candidatus Methanoperedens nitratireducens TaxID=1392998 RepID=UPI0012FE9105|nr:hypothetical protein [Candidatus Methanoperedens nitroreducens]MDJ1422098.1 hypothetical protein [Candidatus Methanoperedens sp.]